MKKFEAEFTSAEPLVSPKPVVNNHQLILFFQATENGLKKSVAELMSKKHCFSEACNYQQGVNGGLSGGSLIKPSHLRLKHSLRRRMQIPRIRGRQVFFHLAGEGIGFF